MYAQAFDFYEDVLYLSDGHRGISSSDEPDQEDFFLILFHTALQDESCTLLNVNDLGENLCT